MSVSTIEQAAEAMRAALAKVNEADLAQSLAKTALVDATCVQREARAEFESARLKLLEAAGDTRIDTFET